MRLHVLLLLTLAVATVKAGITIQSTFLETFLANGTQGPETQWQQQVMTILCNQDNFRDVNVQVGSTFYDIFCQPPQYEFETILRMFVPHSVRRFTAPYCEINQMANVSDPSIPASATVIAANAAERRLLSFFSTIGDFFLNDVATPFDCRFLPAIGVDIASARNPVCGNNAPPGPDPAILGAQINTLEHLLLWILGQLDVDSQFYKEAQFAARLINQTRLALEKEDGQLVLVNQTIRAAADASDQQYSLLQTQFGQIQQDLATQYGITVGLSQRGLMSPRSPFVCASSSPAWTNFFWGGLLADFSAWLFFCNVELSNTCLWPRHFKKKWHSQSKQSRRLYVSSTLKLRMCRKKKSNPRIRNPTTWMILLQKSNDC